MYTAEMLSHTEGIISAGSMKGGDLASVAQQWHTQCWCSPCMNDQDMKSVSPSARQADMLIRRPMQQGNTIKQGLRQPIILQKAS